MQQFESVEQGYPSCPHPPGASPQRAGWPPVAGQSPEQQSEVAQQTSPGELQYEIGSHRPSSVPVPDAPRQFVEQQSAG